MYGYIYKVSNTVNSKPYIGQTTRTPEERFEEHLKACTAKARCEQKFYAAIVELGKDKFYVETIDCAKSQEELNEKEKYWIKYYNSIENGYNSIPGGQDQNPMDFEPIKEKHDAKMRSDEVRQKISKTMSELRTSIGFSKEHKQKIKESREKRKTERAALGLSFYDHPENMASRSMEVYCILYTGERFEFDSILHAGKWWYENYKPFGDIYSTATYQRKIEASIAGKKITFGCPTHKCYKVIDNITWFRKGGDTHYE